MIFRILFKKKLKKIESQKKELYIKIRELNSEKNDLKKEVKFEQKRFKRIEFLLNNRVHNNTKCFIEKTKKGINVLTAIKESEFEVEVFNIDNIEYNLNRELVLWARKRDKEYFIQDIQGGKGNGHGEIAMNHLISSARKEKKERITGEISSVDYDHKDRLTAFYEKMGFEVNIGENKNGTIIKKL